jgi:Na+-driven multidrug efflux pump
MYARPSRRGFVADIPTLARVAIPAVATNLATPVASVFVTAMLSKFGNDAVAAWAIAGRIMPVAFGVVFSLSGAVGPIIGQNFGARAYERVRTSYFDAIKANVLLCAIASVVLIVAEPLIIRGFTVTPRTEELVRFYCLYAAPLFHFVGLMFVANAAFNVLGRPHYGTALNWARATLGTIPLVWLGGNLAGAEGAFLGSGAGGIVFGPLAAWIAYRILPRREAT